MNTHGHPTRRRGVTVIGAASNIGIKPYDGERRARALDRAPAVLREQGLIGRLGADDRGDVSPPPYRDYVRTPGAIRNEEGVVEYSRTLGDVVAKALDPDRFLLVLGGDCSIVLGSLLGARRRAGRVGLVYVDSHADFATPEESATGSAASMCLAQAVGRGESALARLAGPDPLVEERDVVLVGRRDEEEKYGLSALRAGGILDLPEQSRLSATPEAIAVQVLDRVAADGLAGFWVHVDADVLDPEVMPAVDSPEPGGPDFDALARLLAPLVSHPGALGMQLTIYDPELDTAGREGAAQLVSMLERILGEGNGRTEG